MPRVLQLEDKTNITIDAEPWGSGGSGDVYKILSPSYLTNQVVKLYPNPVNNLLYIENNNGFPIEKVRILDPIGKIILQKTNSFETINVENLNSGLYLLQITTENNQIITQKFLKQ